MRSALVVGAVLAATGVAGAEPCRMTVSFAPGASALTSNGKRTLDPLRDQLRAHHELRVQIIAAAAPISTKRTEAAKWYLVDGGIENDRIDTSTSMAVTARDDVQIALVGAACEASARPRDAMVSDASDLANLLAGGEPAPQPPPVKAPASQLPPTATKGLHIGNDEVGFRGDTSVHAQAAFIELPLALAALRGTSAQHHEDEVSREALATQQQPTQKGPFRLDSREMRELSRCYRKALAFDPSTSNEVDLSFAIDRRGKVVAPMAVSDSGELDTCLSGVMARWKFPGKATGKNRIWLTVALAPR